MNRPGSVTNLKNTTYQANYIIWTWTDPVDGDFHHTVVYLNGLYQNSVLKGTQFYNATGLNPDSVYTLSVGTVDNDWNYNLTFVANTSKTAPVCRYPPLQHHDDGSDHEYATTAVPTTVVTTAVPTTVPSTFATTVIPTTEVTTDSSDYSPDHRCIPLRYLQQQDHMIRLRRFISPPHPRERILSSMETPIDASHPDIHESTGWHAPGDLQT